MRRPVIPFLLVALTCHATPAFAQSAPSATQYEAEPAAAAPSADQQEAARRFEHAVKLYGEAEYALALAEFERVYDLVPDYRVLYNIGQVSMQLGRYARALRVLDEYLQRGGEQIDAERRAHVAADLDSLKGRVALLELVVEPVGADILVDGVSVGTAPLAKPVVVDVGARRVQVRSTGYRTRDETLRLAGGDRRELKFVLEREPERLPTAPEPVSAKPSPGAAPPPDKSAVAGPSVRWIGWTAAGALAAGAAVTGTLGITAASDLQRERDSATATRQSLDAAERRAKTFLLTADLLGAAALVTGGVTLYFELSKSKERGHGAVSSVSLALAPRSIGLTLQH